MVSSPCSVSCYSKEVVDTKQLPAAFKAACRAAFANRSVAHILLPTNISGQPITVDVDRLRTFSLSGGTLPGAPECEAATAMLAQAQRPVILARVGCASAVDELIDFAKHIGAPIVRTHRAKDAIDDDHPMCIEGTGLLGGSPGIHALEHVDVLLMARWQGHPDL